MNRIIGKNCSYPVDFLQKNMMGPNSMRIIAELAPELHLEPGMRLLDLGCGKGLTSIFLAQEYDVTVFATDLWISATENYERIRALGLDKSVIPIQAEAHNLPFAHGYFDAAVCIDAYHYFGAEPDYLAKHWAPVVKTGGPLAIAVPGLKKDFTAGVPVELLPYWVENMNFYSCDWWRALWEASGVVKIRACAEMECFDEAWSDWLSCDNEHARQDVGMMKAEGGKYFNLVAMVAEKLQGD